MSMNAVVYLLFGEMGTGKSYWRNRLKRALRGAGMVTSVEGDAYVPWEMSMRVRKLLPPKREHIEEIVDELVKVPVKKVMRGFKHIIISQALYKDADRRYLIGRWQALGFTVVPVWVRVGFWQNLKQLWSRDRGGLRWVAYWLLNKRGFEEPTHNFVAPEDVAALYSYACAPNMSDVEVEA